MIKKLNPKYVDLLKINIILNYIKENSEITSTELAEIFGLSRQGINNILQKLLDEDLIFSSGYGCSTKKGGKRPKLYIFNKSSNREYKRVSFIIDIYYSPGS
jgi:predicted HTH transcriptional regulator